MAFLFEGLIAYQQALLFAEEVFLIQGAVFEVYRAMGAGFLEAVYQECLAIEFQRRGIPFAAKPTLAITYKGQPLKQGYAPDFISFGEIIIELKSARQLAPEHRAQTLNYLRATGKKLGLLVNFGTTPRVQIERFAL